MLDQETKIILRESQPIPRTPMPKSIAAIPLWFLAFLIGASNLHRLLGVEIGGVAVYAGLGLALALFGLAATMSWMRDVRKWRSVMVLQIIIGTAGGVVAFFATNDFWARGLALLAAVVTVADAIEKLRKASKPPSDGAA